MQESKLTHPNAEKLTAFGLGRLPEIEAGQIEQHLTTCEECRNKVAETPADAFVELVRSSASDTLDGRAGPAGDTDSSAMSKASVAPLHERLKQIIAGKGEKDAPAPKPAAAPKLGFVPPRELEGHARYQVTALLGAGGMGNVYQAQHRMMDRFVALKVVNPLLVNRPGAAERFEREVKAAAKLVHPNIVTAFDAEKVGDTHILVMEYVEGQTLADLLASQRELPVDKACEYLRKTALGLQHAFERGMVHRDVKPHNLMLASDGEIKILDFGLARFVSEEGPRGATTEHGALMGSPDYMAPEQGHDAHSADARADIYGMGCTLYHLLAGQVPFPANSLLAKLEAHRDAPAIPLHKLRGDVPIALSHVVQKMMAKDPAQRFQTPAEVAEALTPFTRPAPRPAARPAQRRGVFPYVAAALALALVGLAIWAAQVVFRVDTPTGTLTVTTDDPDVQISVRAGGKEIALYYPKQKKEITLAVGKYRIEVLKGIEGMKLETNQFEITNEQKKVSVAFVPDRPAAAPQTKTPELPSVAELLRARKVRTVAQDGSGDHQTIQAALDAVQANEVIVVRGKGPYRETPRKALPANVALVSEDGATVEIADFNPNGVALRAQGSLFLSGIHWTAGASLPADAAGFLVDLRGTGDVTVGHCSFSGDLPNWYVGLNCWTDPDATGRVLLQENRFHRRVQVVQDQGSVTIQRNWFGGPSTHKSNVHIRHLGAFAFQQNVMQENAGLQISAEPLDATRSQPGVDVDIRNNLFDTSEGPIGFWSNAPDREVLPRSVRIANNLILSRDGKGILLRPETLKLVEQRWRIGPNAYARQPVDGAFWAHGAALKIDAVSWRVTDRDRIVAQPFRAVAANAPDYLRLPADGELATQGAGGELPTYFGPFPPGPAPSVGDWFTKLQTRMLSEPQPVRLNDVADLKQAVVLFDDPLADPKRSLFGHDGTGWTFENGRLVSRGGHRYCRGDTRHHFDLDFACETVASVSGTHKGWGLAVFGATEEKENALLEEGIEILLSDRGELTVVPSRWIASKTPPAPRVGPIPVASFKRGAANALTVVVRDCRTVDVHVNGVRACEPLQFGKRTRGVNLQLVSLGGDDGVLLSFERFKVWSLAPQFAWPAAALREGRIPAPDLSKAKVVTQDGWANEKDSGPEINAGKTTSFGVDNGRFYMHHHVPGWAAWNWPGKHTAFVAQAEGRTADAAGNEWGLQLPNDARATSLVILANGQGTLRVAMDDHAKGVRLPPLAQVTHPAIRRGAEFNRIAAILRGRTLEVYVNGVAVCDPIEVDLPLEPLNVRPLTIGAQVGRLEFRHFSVSSAEGLPTPEDRRKSGDVP